MKLFQNDLKLIRSVSLWLCCPFPADKSLKLWQPAGQMVTPHQQARICTFEVGAFYVETPQIMVCVEGFQYALLPFRKRIHCSPRIYWALKRQLQQRPCDGQCLKQFFGAKRLDQCVFCGKGRWSLQRC